MCSVFGYIGKQYSRQLVLDGLTKLEYRGYDAAGFACLDSENAQLRYVKAQGHLDKLTQEFEHTPIDGTISIGHTRWATHGGFSLDNAHPHFDCHKRIALMHNGIIENHHELRERLTAQGHAFHSDTDTEVIAHLLEKEIEAAGFSPATMAHVVLQLEGAYAIVAIFQQQPDTMFIARKRSPLCVGIGEGEFFIASDPMAFADKTSTVLFLPDESFALVLKNELKLFNFAGQPLDLAVSTVAIDALEFDKKGHAHYMLKEIYEQNTVIQATLSYLRGIHDTIWQQLGISAQQAKNLTAINMIGCGTSWFAGRISQFFFEQICHMPAKVHLASEFRYMPFFKESNDLFIAISQSGETADTLEALRMVKQTGAATVGLSNVASSSLVREAQGHFLTKAGKEVSVASTKAFSTQITALYWLAHRLALHKGIIDQAHMDAAMQELAHTAQILESTIDTCKIKIINELAPFYAQFSQFIFLGRHISYPFAMEAALKLKEITYIFAQCYPAGELKHGPLALIDSKTPVVIFSHQDPLIYQKLVANAQEVKARNGHLLVFAFAGQDELIELADTALLVPNVPPLLGPLAMTGLMQFFVYQIALVLGRPIDKPRNLAKSVTVE